MSIMGKMMAPIRAVPGVNKITKQVGKVPGMGAVNRTMGMNPPSKPQGGVGPSPKIFGQQIPPQMMKQGPVQQGGGFGQMGQMAQNMGRFGGGMFGGNMQRPMQPQLPQMEAPPIQAPQEPQTGEPVQQPNDQMQQDQAIQRMQNMQQEMGARPSVMPQFGGQAQMGQGIGPRPQMFGGMMAHAPQMMGRGFMGMRGMF